MHFRLLTVAAIVWTAGAQAAPTWSRISSPPGGDLGCFVFDQTHPGVTLAGSNGGLIYRSINGGGSWSRIRVGNIDEEFRVIAQSPAQPDVFYAYGSGFSTTATGPSGTGRLYISQDDGVSWAPTAHQPPNDGGNRGLGRGMAIDPTGRILVLSDRFGGIFRSTNAGQSWAVVQPHDTSPFGLAADPTHPGTLYVAASHTNQAGVQRATILKSPDFGATWSVSQPSALTIGGGASAYAIAVQPGTGTLFATYFGYDPTTYQQVYGVARSMDAGATWVSDNAGLQTGYASGSPSGAIVFDPATPSTVYLSTDASNPGFYTSTDNGDHWTPTGDAVPLGGGYVAAARPATGPYPAAVFVGNPGIAVSTNSGKSWTTELSGFNHSQITAIADSGKANGYYAIASSGVYRTLNGGATWVPAASLPGSPYGLAVDLTRATSRVYVLINNTIYRSSNGGDSWLAVKVPVEAGQTLQRLTVDSSGTLFATDYGHTVYRSANEGQGWAATTIGNASDTFFGRDSFVVSKLSGSASAPGVAYASLTSGLWASSDEGTHWTLAVPQNPNNQVYDLAVSHSAPYTAFESVFDGALMANAVEEWTPGSAGFQALAPQAYTQLPNQLLTAPAGNMAFGVYSTTDVELSTDDFTSSSNIATAIAAAYSGGYSVGATTASSLFIFDQSGNNFVLSYSSLAN